MKYCTNCGAALEDSTTSFCAECGKPLSSESGDSVKNPVENKKAKHKETKKKDEVLEEIVGEPVDDGYQYKIGKKEWREKEYYIQNDQ